MRLLVTGGAGFIGSHFVRTLLAGGYAGHERTRVTVLDKLTYAGNRANLPPSDARLDFVHGDVCDARLLRELLPGHDAVVHFAAESHVDRSVHSAAAFVRTNVGGTQVLLDACLAAGVERVVHISTDEVYGSIADGSWDEDRPLLPNSPYAASKASSDLIARSYWRTHGLDVSITRCSNNYGPFQHPEKLIPLFVTNLLEGEDLPLYGDGRNVREWLHVDDHCRAIALVLDRGGPAGSTTSATTTGDAGPAWHQPIIVQPEVGILGILVKEFDGVPHFLMQAKMEPGNSNLLQISPTVQATRSNYTKAHKGADVRYLEYFRGPRQGRVLADVLQSEHQARGSSARATATCSSRSRAMCPRTRTSAG
ncbi:GDP-mannose 4,6-dehydratase [Streptomyces cyaneofuscatus]